MYRWTLGLDPNYPTGRTQLAMCLATAGDLNGVPNTGRWKRCVWVVMLGRSIASWAVIDSAKKADDLRDAARKSAASMTTSKLPVEHAKSDTKERVAGFDRTRQTFVIQGVAPERWRTARALPYWSP